ncbi:MAG: aminopeptidase [Thiotrichales bacterium]
MRVRGFWKWLALAGASLVILGSCVGCGTLGYYTNSARGHLDLMSRRVAIDELVQSDALDPERRQQLVTAQEVRLYATQRLGLPDNRSYQSYVELGRPFAVWSVVAAPELSLDPKEWCFPIVGCVSYRGYFDEAKAEAFAASLREAGYEVFVGGVQAYSTLGWFADPLLSSMVDRGEVLMAEVVFHELAHQRLYFAHDTEFNEAFATVVGEQGVRRWLSESSPEDLHKYEDWLRHKDDFIGLLKSTSDQLRAVYDADLPEADKRASKAAIYIDLRTRYAELKQRWGGFAGYDRWFEKPVNNARLASVAVYRDLVPEFTRWLASCDYDFERFYTKMATFKTLEKTARHERLKQPERCGGAEASDLTVPKLADAD